MPKAKRKSEISDAETRKGRRAARGSAAPKDLALQLWMQDVTSLLCYQPEVPHAHKESLVKALDHYNKQCAECEQAKRQNAALSDAATKGKQP